MPVQEKQNSCRKSTDYIGNSADPLYVRQPNSFQVPNSKLNNHSLEDDLGDLTLEDIFYYQKEEIMPLNSENNFSIECDDCDSDIFTLEDLKVMYNSCFTCGVSWIDDHVSLDCSECGGYALKRPCPVCEGLCSSKWTRNINMSHNVSHAHWEGSCCLMRPDEPKTTKSIPQSNHGKSRGEQEESEKTNKAF